MKYLGLLFFFWASTAWGAIAVEGSGSESLHPNTAGSVAVSCGTNPNRFLIVVAKLESTTAAFATLTYNGVSLLPHYDLSTNAASQQIFIFKQVGPPTGSNTLAYSIDTNSSWVIAGACFSDVDQVTPHGTLVGANFTGADPTVDVTVAASGLAVDFMTYAGPGTNFAQSALQTEVLEVVNSAVGVTISTLVGVGVVTMSYTDNPAGCCYSRILAIPLNIATTVRRRQGVLVY